MQKHPKKILVTGAAGFIGSHLAEALLQEGHDVVGIDDLSRGHRANVPFGLLLHEADIQSPQTFKILEDFRPEVIFHLAAQIDVRLSVVDPLKDAQCNLLGTLGLLEKAAQIGTDRFILASTGGAIYGEQQSFPANEQHPCQPLSPYGASKYCAEQYLSYYRRCHGLKTSILRYANVYGPKQDPHGEAGVVAIFAQQLLKKKRCRIFGSGLQTRDFVYVTDVVKANLALLDHEGEHHCFNIGTGIEKNILDVYQILAHFTGVSEPPQFAKAKVGEQMRSCLCAALAAKELQWQPTYSLEEGLEKTLQWFAKKELPSINISTPQRPLYAQ